MDLEKNLRDRCKVISGDDGDSFVGVKADTDDAIIYFPIGYQLPENDVDLRIDVQNLFGVLSVFMKEDKVIEARKFEAPQTVDFPIHAYLKVITSFLRTGRYYIESDPEYKTSTKGNTSWPRTVREQRALVQKNGSLVFTNMTVRSVTPNADTSFHLSQKMLLSVSHFWGEREKKLFAGRKSFCGPSRIAGFGEGTPQQVSREGQNRRIADFGTVVETCS